MDGQHFVHQWQASRVVFGAGSLDRLCDELKALGLRRAPILSTPSEAHLAARAATALGERAAGLFDRAVMHGPIEIAREARACAL